MDISFFFSRGNKSRTDCRKRRRPPLEPLPGFSRGSKRKEAAAQCVCLCVIISAKAVFAVTGTACLTMTFDLGY